MPLLTVQNLSFSRNGKTLLNDISFTVERGEYLAVIGPNGAGKSTLLKCLDRILRDWRGEIVFDGCSLRNIAQKKLAQRIAYVHQAGPGVFAFTVRQMVEMGRYPHLNSLAPISAEDREIVENSLDLMNVHHLADRNIETLSGGERQKVQLALALAQQAEVLFLDEPTTWLDYRHQSEIGNLLRSLNQEHSKTIIEVTHDVNRAVLDATHVIALGGGSIVYDGNPQFLMEPEHLRSIYNVDFQMVDHPSLPLKLVVPGI